MAAKGQSYAEKFSRWGVTVTNLRETLDEMPHVAPDLTEMERMLTEARGLESRLEDLRGQGRELTAQLRELTKTGEKLRARLGANLHAKFGFTSESLVRYGFRPLRIVRRRPAVKPPEEPGEERMRWPRRRKELELRGPEGPPVFSREGSRWTGGNGLQSCSSKQPCS